MVGRECEGLTLKHCLYFANRGSHSSDVAVPRRYSVSGVVSIMLLKVKFSRDDGSKKTNS